MNESMRNLVEEAYFETTGEAIGRSLSKLEAHKEGITAAAMLLSSMTGVEDEQAKAEIVGMNLRPIFDA